MTYPAASESKNREQDGEVIKSMTVGTSTRAPNYKKKKKKTYRALLHHLQRVHSSL